MVLLVMLSCMDTRATRTAKPRIMFMAAPAAMTTIRRQMGACWKEMPRGASSGMSG